MGGVVRGLRTLFRKGPACAVLAFLMSTSYAWAQGGDSAGSTLDDARAELRAYVADPIYVIKFLVTSGVILQRLEIILALALLGFAIGVLVSPAARPYVLRALKVLWWAFAALVILLAIFGPPAFNEVFTWGLGIVGGLYAFVVASNFGAQPAPPKPRPISLGSAKWADYRHLLANGIIGSSGFWLGTFRGHPLHYRGARHLLTVAPTRSGKGVSAIIPNLLTYTGSTLVVDPKGENALITAYRRGPGSLPHAIGGLEQKLILVDPWDIAATRLGFGASRFNPLDWIKANDPDATENAFLLADAIVPVAESEGEARFWDEEARSLLVGFILYVALAPEEAERRHLGRVRDILVLDDDTLKDTLTRMFEHKHPVVSSTAARTAAKDPKLRSSVFASAQSHTHFLDSPRIRESLCQSDFAFEDLKTTPLSIYLILPADRLKTYDRWLRLLIQQAITVNARNISVQPSKPILFLLDEMSTLGRLPSVEQAFSLMAGFGMQLWGIVQDLSQLARIYGETGWQTFISNSGVIQYFGSRDKMTAEYFSSLCGVTTVEVESTSRGISRMFGSHRSTSSSMHGGGSNSGSSDTTTQTETVGINQMQRQLAYPDELMVLKGENEIVFVENLDPISAEKIPWYKHEVLRPLGVDLTQPETVAAHVGG